MSDHSDAESSGSGSSRATRLHTFRQERAQRRRIRAERSSAESSSNGSSSSKIIRRAIRRQEHADRVSSFHINFQQGSSLTPAPTPAATAPVTVTVSTPKSACASRSQQSPSLQGMTSLFPSSKQDLTTTAATQVNPMVTTPASSSASQAPSRRSWWASLSPFQQARYREIPFEDCNQLDDWPAPRKKRSNKSTSTQTDFSKEADP